MKPPSVRSRIRNGALLMLVLVLAIGALAVPTIHRLGHAINRTLYRNYLSIEAAEQMHSALYAIQLAQYAGNLKLVLPPNQDRFNHWLEVELGNITEVGEGPLAESIKRDSHAFFAEIQSNPTLPPENYRAQLVTLHGEVDGITELNEKAMFRADSRSIQMADRLASEFALGLTLILLIGIALASTIAWNVARPLRELTDHLRSFSLHGPSGRLGEQPLAELQDVAVEFNKMAERLEQFERLNVDRIVYEKAKTEAIIESIEDGIILIDPKGIITHINEMAAIVLGVDARDALGSPFADLDSNHPHYMRIRGALESIAHQGSDAMRVEVDLHVRGRDHTYLLKPVPLHQSEGQSFGTILILQDITYLRDKDRARTNLVATLSHELKTPLTSLALSAELLARSSGNLDSKQRELIDAINEDLRRMRSLANDLLDLARGEMAAITVQSVPLDVAPLIHAVVRSFALQADQKSIALKESVNGDTITIRADPVKLSWVISNLIANALRYTPNGGAIQVSSASTPDGLSLRVSDTGPGVPPELREHLFERFAQWNVNGVAPGSAGLGLAIAKEIVEAHGGRIFVDNAPDHGTCFTVELPAMQGESWLES
jgi:two-component system, NtrC family, sensor histidine kinase KinB